MNIQFFYFIISRIDNFNFINARIFFVTGIFSILGLIFLVYIYEENRFGIKEDWFNLFLSIYKKGICIFIISSILCIVVPSKNELIFYYVSPKIKNNETLINMPEKTIKPVDDSIWNLLNDKIKRELTEK
jgi:hypothetical protein